MRRLASFTVALVSAIVIGLLAPGVVDRIPCGDASAPVEAGEQLSSVETGTCDSAAFVLAELPPPCSPDAGRRRTVAAATHRLSAGVRPVLYHPPQGSRE